MLTVVEGCGVNGHVRKPIIHQTHRAVVRAISLYPEEISRVGRRACELGISTSKYFQLLEQLDRELTLITPEVVRDLGIAPKQEVHA